MEYIFLYVQYDCKKDGHNKTLKKLFAIIIYKKWHNVVTFFFISLPQPHQTFDFLEGIFPFIEWTQNFVYILLHWISRRIGEICP